MAFSQFGVEQERLVVYFHDAPGSPQECAVTQLRGFDWGELKRLKRLKRWQQNNVILRYYVKSVQGGSA